MLDAKNQFIDVLLYIMHSDFIHKNDTF